MTAWVRVFDHPYATITREDGLYEIPGVPAGVKVRVFAWHEEVGWVNQNRSKGEELELKEGVTTKEFKVEAEKK
jgi:hypothetical protein